jgi:hypothetical protein
MNAHWKIFAVVLPAVILALFIMPAIPTRAASTNFGPSGVPPLNVAVLTDPSGTYQFMYVGNGTYSMNLTAYEKLLNDPYSAISASSIEIDGNTVFITVPVSDVVSGTTSSPGPPIPSPSIGFESVTSYLIGFGGMYINGRYILGTVWLLM